MADKTYKLNISKSDGSFNDSVQFTIPQKEGTYKVEFELSNGNKVNAGSINVSTVEKTYKAEFQLSDGNTIDGGTFTTPVVVPEWHVVGGGEELYLTKQNPTKQLSFEPGGKRTRLTGYTVTEKVDNVNFNAVELSTENVVLASGNRESGAWLYSITVNGKITTDGKIEINGTARGTNVNTGGREFYSMTVYITKIEQFY